MRHGPQVAARGGKAHLSSYLVEGRAHGLRGGRAGSWLRRGDELDELRTALVALASGRGSAVALVGAVGTGKSRFIREIRDLASRRGTTFLGVRCTALGTERPLEPLLDLVAAVLGVDAEASVDELVAASGRLHQLGLSQRDLSAIATLLGATPAQPPEPGEVWAAVARVLRGLAADHPVIVAFDDAHALPTAWHGDLAHLVRSLADVPVLFLLALQEPHPAALGAIARPVRLGAFDGEQQARFVEGLLGVKQVDPELMRMLGGACEGNPLYLQEMLKFLVESRRIDVAEGRATLSPGATGGDASLPHTLQALISARIDALDYGCRGLLQLAAVAGESFDEAVIVEAAGLTDPAPMLLELVSHGLLRREPSSPDQWAFASPLVREAALRGTLGVQRRDYHRLVAAALEKVYEGRLDPFVDALVVHCAEGGRLVDAARYAFRAGQRRETEQHLEQARDSYLAGLEHLARADRNPDEWDARIQGEAMLNLALGQVLVLLGDPADGHRRLLVALDVASETGLPWIEARAHVALGRSYQELGRRELAKAHLGQARAVLRIDPDPDVEREAVEASAILAFGLGQNEEAEELWQQALKLADGNPAAMARCQIGLANRYLRSGDHDRARELLERALGTVRSAGDRILEGRVLNNIGLVHSWAGRHPLALQYYRAALELREGLGYTRGVVVNHHNIGDVHFHCGDHARAHVAFARSRELADEIGWERGVALNDVFLAYLDARSASGTVDDVLAAAERARSLADPDIVATGLWLAGRWLLEDGQPDAAREKLGEALDEARRFELQPMIARLERTLAELGGDSVAADAEG
ncbi:MAG: tetratricopeptide repeat protein [Myxococcota bacterium]